MSKKLTNEEYQTRLNEIYEENEYIVLEEYKSSKAKIFHLHTKCNKKFKSTPYNLLINKCTCPNCNNIKKHNKSNTEEFKQKVYKLYNNEYTVLGDYINNKTKIKMLHNKCNTEFEIAPNNFLLGRKCPKCSKRLRKNTEIVKKEIYDLYNNEYTLLSEYINDKTKIKIKHNKCNNDFEVKPSYFLKENGTRCPYCFGSKKKTTEEYKKEVYNKVKDEYTVLGDYINTNTKILHRHNKCNKEYLVSPNKFLNYNRRCPYCKSSKGEEKIREWLLENNIVFEEQYSFKDCKNINPLKFDFKININNSFILLEYDGIQHFENTFYTDDFEKQKIRDNIKNQYCENNDYKLIRISYKDYNNIVSILNKLIK
jgi:hypothetical protein